MVEEGKEKFCVSSEASGRCNIWESMKDNHPIKDIFLKKINLNTRNADNLTVKSKHGV